MGAIGSIAAHYRSLGDEHGWAVSRDAEAESADVTRTGPSAMTSTRTAFRRFFGDPFQWLRSDAVLDRQDRVAPMSSMKGRLMSRGDAGIS